MLRRLAQIIAALAGVGILFVIIQYPVIPMHSYFWDRTADTGHLIIFGLLTCMLLWMLRVVLDRRRIGRQYAAACFISMVAGCLLELWQGSHGRSAEWIDVYSDLLGVLSFAALHAMFDSRIKTPRSGWLRASRLLSIASLLIAAGLVPYAIDCNEFLIRNRIFPLLVDFQRPWYKKFYYTNQADFDTVPRPAPWSATYPNVVAKIVSRPDAKYPAFVMKDPYTKWEGFRRLEVELFVEDPPKDLKCAVRVHDAIHRHEADDRFGKQFSVQPGFQILSIPLDEIRRGPRTRKMMMNHIDGMAVFFIQPASPVTFYLGEIRLVH